MPRAAGRLRSRSLLVFGLATILAFVSGCTGFRGSKGGPALEQRENLVYVDGDLLPWVPAEVLTAERTQSGRTKVYARFVNQRNTTVECQIKVKFMAAGGRVLDETNWMPVLFPRRASTEFEQTSLATDVADFVVIVRLAE